MQPLRVLGIADLHDCIEMLPSVGNLAIDIIALCGDLHNGSDKVQAKPIAEAIANLGPPVLIVPGNTDSKEVVPDLWRDAGLMMIHCGSSRQGDYGFIGMGGMVIHNPKRQGNPARYYFSDSDIYESLVKTNKEVSDLKRRIVLTHQPPFGARDVISSGKGTGSKGLRRFVEEYQPDLLLCGHIHEDRGESCIGSTKIVNVGEMRKGYAAIIEIRDGIDVRWLEP